jgi:hypothetical protein
MKLEAASHSNGLGEIYKGKTACYMARPDGFEPPTPRFVVWCSIQLSYGRVLRIARENIPKRAKPLGTGL